MPQFASGLPFAPSDSTIIVSTTAPFDFTPEDGTASGRVSFQTTIEHETFHALGFTCGIDSTGTAQPNTAPFFTCLDLYRYDAAVASSGISAQECANEVRTLQRTTSAVSGFYLSAESFTFPRSQGQMNGGDGAQAAHWKRARLLPTGLPIGIMDPGDARSSMSPADITAIDFLGWAADFTQLFGGANPATEIMPSSGTFVAASEPLTISWTVDSSVSTSSVSVFERRAGVDRDRVFRVADITSSSVSVPPNTLAAGREYVVFITTENSLGYGQHAPHVLYTRSVCPADYDGSGTTTVGDIFIFLNL
ncbi:MAG: NF038122 family metalloprotease [Phycisphaerales bacterium]|nr:NF038122 family metalloprotease [Phycisphaerales bacterium]